MTISRSLKSNGLLGALYEYPAKDLLLICGAGASFPQACGIPKVHTFVEVAIKLSTDDTEILGAVSAELENRGIGPRFEVLMDEFANWLIQACALERCSIPRILGRTDIT